MFRGATFQLARHLECFVPHNENKIIFRAFGITNVITVDPDWDMNICTKCHGNPSNSCWYISVWTKIGHWLNEGCEVQLKLLEEDFYSVD